MVKHIILWTLKEMPEDEKKQVKQNAKAALEALAGKIDGLTSIKVVIDNLPTSNADMMLDSEFVSAEALAAYQDNEHHQCAAGNFVRPFYDTRLCLDYEI